MDVGYAIGIEGSPVAPRHYFDANGYAASLVDVPPFLVLAQTRSLIASRHEARFALFIWLGRGRKASRPILSFGRSCRYLWG